MEGVLIAVRVPEKVKTDFRSIAQEYGGTAHVLRELIIGFIENRIEIQPPKLYTKEK